MSVRVLFIIAVVNGLDVLLSFLFVSILPFLLLTSPDDNPSEDEGGSTKRLFVYTCFMQIGGLTKREVCTSSTCVAGVIETGTEVIGAISAAIIVVLAELLPICFASVAFNDYMKHVYTCPFVLGAMSAILVTSFAIIDAYSFYYVYSFTCTNGVMVFITAVVYDTFTIAESV